MKWVKQKVGYWCDDIIKEKYQLGETMCTRNIYRKRAETILLISSWSLLFISTVIGVIGAIAQNEILQICTIIGFSVSIILILIWYMI